MKGKILLMLMLSLLFVASPVFSDELPLPAEQAFQKAITVLMDMGAVPSFRDKELLLIKTDPFPVKLTTENADCGKMFGIPYLKDKRVKTALVYQVRIKKLADNKSDVDTKITIDGYMDVNEDAPFFIEKNRDKNKALTCKSIGVLEKNFIELLSK